jgi:hypothetical protein
MRHMLSVVLRTTGPWEARSRLLGTLDSGGVKSAEAAQIDGAIALAMAAERCSTPVYAQSSSGSRSPPRRSVGPSG